MVFIHLLISPSRLTRPGYFHTLHQLPLLLCFLAPFLQYKLPSSALPPCPGRLGPCGRVSPALTPSTERCSSRNSGSMHTFTQMGRHAWGENNVFILFLFIFYCWAFLASAFNKGNISGSIYRVVILFLNYQRMTFTGKCK